MSMIDLRRIDNGACMVSDLVKYLSLISVKTLVLMPYADNLDLIAER